MVVLVILVPYGFVVVLVAALLVVLLVVVTGSTGCAGVLPALCGAGSDFTYASRRMRSSSLTCPWKVGMTGWNPAAIFACGWRIDSRM
jgi:hypothetical protein